MPTYTTPYNLAKPLVNDPTDQDLWGGELNSNMDIIAAALPQTGDYVYSAAATRTYALICDGSAVSRTTYATLFGVIGTTYGVGDGSTTFNVPNIKGRILAGRDNMGGSAAGRLTGTTMTPDGNTMGATGGEQTHTLITSEMPSHAHPTGQFLGSIPAGGTGYTGNDNGGGSAPDGLTGATGGGSAHNNVQPTMLCNVFIIY